MNTSKGGSRRFAGGGTDLRGVVKPTAIQARSRSGPGRPAAASRRRVHRKPEIEKRNERPEIVDRRTGRAPLTARVGLLASDEQPLAAGGARRARQRRSRRRSRLPEGRRELAIRHASAHFSSARANSGRTRNVGYRLLVQASVGLRTACST